MLDESGSTPTKQRRRQEPRRVRLPGFVSEEPVGLGDVIKRTTSVAGIKPCTGCGQRARRLNGWLIFSGRSDNA
jgi:hypothetical protein